MLMADQDMIFTTLHGATQSIGPRCGRLALRGRVALDTPNLIGITSRGAVPHLAQDVYRSHTDLHGAYYALEDSPQATPPIFNLPQAPSHPTERELSPFKSFVGLPQDDIFTLAVRRTPAVPSAGANASKTMQIKTSIGFRVLDVTDYSKAIRTLKPDIAVAPADLTYPLDLPLGSRKKRNMGDRTGAWVTELVAALKTPKTPEEQGTMESTHLLAPVLPLPLESQWLYLSDLTEESTLPHLQGLAIYNSDILAEGTLPEALSRLPRFSFDVPSGPHKVLSEVSAGIDVFTLPFITAATEAGVALTFTLPQRATDSDPSGSQSLGLDLGDPVHATDVSPIMPDCECYACTNHHRAFIQHLLNAKEMLSWTLLQIHNHYVVSRFFADIRRAIQEGWFEEAKERFHKVWETEIPSGTTKGPRIRGYQFKTEQGDKKKNEAPYKVLGGGKESLAEAMTPDPLSP